MALWILIPWSFNLRKVLLEHHAEVHTHVPIRVTTAVMKHHDQEQVGEERVNSAYTSISLFHH